MRRSVELSDPHALRALAHPLRMTLLGLLRREGPLTATQAAELSGESPASCSFHFRQLARYGLVEEAGGGRGRERPWRATAQFTSWPSVARTPALAAAARVLELKVAERYFEQLVGWLRRRGRESAAWQEAGALGDRLLYLTADELIALRRDIGELLERYQPRTARPRLRPDGVRRVTVLELAFPDDA